MGAAVDEFVIDFVDVFNQGVSKPGMISRRFRGHFVSALAEHYFEISEREKFPARSRKITIESEFVDVIIGLDLAIVENAVGQLVPRIERLWTKRKGTKP